MKKMILIMVLAFAMLLQGCSSKSSDQVSNDKPTTTPKITEAAQDNAAVTTTVAPTEKPADLVLPVVGNDTGKLLIQTVSMSSTYPFNSYIITSANGESIVVDPTSMPKKDIVDINPAAILETHSHPDHIDAAFELAYKGVPMLKYTEGTIDTKDFHIYSVLSSHNDDNISTSNVIMVMEVDGLRIAHMGDIGQTALTDDQLKAIGKIDIAFMQFENSYSSMNLENEKGFKLIEQLNPSIIIPTHYTQAAQPVLEEKYGAITNFDNILEISKDDIPEGTLHVYEISNTHKYY